MLVTMRALPCVMLTFQRVCSNCGFVSFLMHLSLTSGSILIIITITIIVCVSCVCGLLCLLSLTTIFSNSALCCDTAQDRQELLRSLPEENQAVIQRLMDLVYSLSKHASKTKMDTANLAMVWAPLSPLPSPWTRALFGLFFLRKDKQNNNSSLMMDDWGGGG